MTEDKELFFKINMLEQYMKNMQEQIEAVEKELEEMNSLKEGLKELKNSTGKEVFASVGKSIFIKTKIISEELLVGVGEKSFVKKSIPDTVKLMELQIEKLLKIREELANEIENLRAEGEKIILSIENRKESK